MDRRFAVVSTCSKKGWDEYGERFVRSFLDYYPAETVLYMYIDFKPTVRDPRVVYRDLNVCRGLHRFHQDIAALPFASGGDIVHDTHDQAHNPEVVWNAAKFSYKVFSVEHAVLNAAEDVVTWVDADTVAFRPVPAALIATLIPPYCMTSYLARQGKYSECGYVSYNRQHAHCAAFVAFVADLYRTGVVFALKEWHDSYVWDLARATFEREWNVRNYNISYREMTHSHVFINSPLGQYLDHLKGPRKAEGRSRQSDLAANHRDIAYWAEKLP